MKLEPNEIEPVLTMAAIGNVCLQWSRFEYGMLMVILALEDIPREKGDIIYGGLDWKPRLNMAVNLAEFHRAPLPIRKRLRDLRTRIRNEDLNERRNQVVHGAQAISDEVGKIDFYMSRWPKPKKVQALSPQDIGKIGVALMEIGQEAYDIFIAVGDWKFPKHGKEDESGALPVGNTVPVLEFAKSLYSRIKSAFG